MTENNENFDDKEEAKTDTSTALFDSSSSEQQQPQMTYSREEMLALRDARLSRLRPPELSRDFDSDKGLFSPDKWVQYKWQCEGVEPRGRRRNNNNNSVPVTGSNALPLASMSVGTNPKTLSSILESTIAATKNDDFWTITTLCCHHRDGDSLLDVKRHLLQSRQTNLIINNHLLAVPVGKLKIMELTLNLLLFQKNALEANSRSSRSSQNNTVSSGKEVGHSTSWNTSGHSKQGDKGRRFGDREFSERERTRSSNTESEQVPEWMNAGPTSVFDVIELKGFDDDEEQQEQPATEKKRKRSKGRKDSNNGNNHLKASSETYTGPTTQKSTSSSSRQKRHSSGDCAPNNNKNNSRPSSRNKTPQRTDSSFSKQSSHSPVRVIQAADLELSILREHQEKLEKEKKSSSTTKIEDLSTTFDLFAALGIQPPSKEKGGKDKTTLCENKLPNSDAEFAACILGLPIDQIAKIMPNVIPSTNNNNNESIQQQKHQQQQQTLGDHQPTTSRLLRWQQKATTTTNLNIAAISENNLNKIGGGGDEELKSLIRKDLMMMNNNNEESTTSKMNKHLLSLRAAQFVPQQPFVFNPRNSSSSPAPSFQQPHQQPSPILSHQQQQRPASADYSSRLFASSFPYPIIDQHCSPPPPQLTQLFNSSGAAAFGGGGGGVPPSFGGGGGHHFGGGGLNPFGSGQFPGGMGGGQYNNQQHLGGPHHLNNNFGPPIPPYVPNMPFTPPSHQQQFYPPFGVPTVGGGPGGPGGFGGGAASGGGGSLTSNNSSAILQKMFAEAKRNELIQSQSAGRAMMIGGPSQHHPLNNNFAPQLPPFAPTMPFNAPPSHHQQQPFYPPFGVSGGGGGGLGGGPGLNNPNIPPYHPNRQQSPYHLMNFPPPLVNTQQQQQQKTVTTTTHHQNLLNSPAFMPTSVMRQMSKMPGGGSSVNSGGDSASGGGVGGAVTVGGTSSNIFAASGGNSGGGLTSNNSSALLQKMFAEAKRNELIQSQSSSGRAILGRDPYLDVGILTTITTTTGQEAQGGINITTTTTTTNPS
uniref:Uncharacterized protein n=1 Tax=Meloidogyne enterolobii TaxID=390850 RepID=A0A6V7VD44_MELEN|nr:unnamed protein product [Meloidogyne enterolobii]